MCLIYAYRINYQKHSYIKTLVAIQDSCLFKGSLYYCRIGGELTKWEVTKNPTNLIKKNIWFSTSYIPGITFEFDLTGFKVLGMTSSKVIVYVTIQGKATLYASRIKICKQFMSSLSARWWTLTKGGKDELVSIYWTCESLFQCYIHTDHHVNLVKSKHYYHLIKS